jgi:hypothetical protein
VVVPQLKTFIPVVMDSVVVGFKCSKEEAKAEIYPIFLSILFLIKIEL